MQIPEPYFTRVFKPTVFVLALLPLAWLTLGVWLDTLGANPVEYIMHSLGQWGLRLLLLTLLMSTLRRWASWTQGLRLRRMLGLFAFFYATLHVFSYLLLDQAFDWSEIWPDILDRPFITAGMLAFLLMTPLAATSFNKAMRKLGRNWLRLHKLIYPLTILVVVHFWWMEESKQRLDLPQLYAALLAILLGERLYQATKRKWPGKRSSKAGLSTPSRMAEKRL